MAVGSHSAGAHSAPTPQAGFTKATGAPIPPEPRMPQQASGRLSGVARVTGLAVGGLLIALAVVYCLGCVFFYQRFYPNTDIGAANVSLMAAGSAKTQLQQASDAHSVSVAGQGVSFELDGANAGLELNVGAAVDAALEQNSSWQWPLQIFQEHDRSEVLSTSFDTELLRTTIASELQEYNGRGTDPTNAFLYYDATTGTFQINPGSMGTKLDVDRVLQTVTDALVNQREHAALTSRDLVQQQVTANDERLIAARDTANDLLQCDLQLTCAGNVVTTLNADVVKDFIVFGEDYSVTIDDARIVAWVDALEEQVDTAGDDRAYTRPDGKYIEVAGGSKYGSYYGWISDGWALEEMVRYAINNDSVGAEEIPWKQTAATYNPGGQDWGLRYIDVDLTEQYARFYDESGYCFWETPIISGSTAVPGRDTPVGVYYVTNKARNVTLVGLPDPNNNYEPLYRTLVYYWMPFIDNMVGLHDAYWQPYFGPTVYQTLDGSHGCINVPPDMAEWLYSVIQIGDVVVTHY